MPDELDQMLDEAIHSYSAKEPSADLAVRILREAQVQKPSPRRRWKLALAFALPVAAALVLAFVVLGPWTLPEPPAAIASVPSVPIMVYAHVQPTKMLAAATRKPVRPLSPPYSKEVMALLNFVQQHPKEAAEIAKAQRQQAAAAQEPIRIAPIQIQPITIAALN